MMKKVWLALLAVVLVFGLVMVGCGGGGDKEKEGGDPPTGFTSNLSGLTGDIVKNQYSEDADDSRGLQLKFNPAAMMNGYQVQKDDTFKLEIKFKLDKALDYDLEIGLVDTTVGSDEGYWRPLTWKKGEKMYLIDKAKLGTADTEITETIELTALVDSSDKAAAANSLVFETRDVWTKSPVKITFVSFIFIMGDGGEGNVPEPPPPPPPPPSVKIKVGSADQSVEVKGVGANSKTELLQDDETGFTFEFDANYGNSYAYFQVDFGSGKLSGFSKVTFNLTGVSGDLGDKRVALLAKNEAFAGYQDMDSSFVNTPGGNSGGNWDKPNGIKVNITTTKTAVELPLDSTKTTGFDSDSKVYICIYVHADDKKDGVPTKFTISDIKFE